MRYYLLTTILSIFISSVAIADKSFTIQLTQELKEGYVLLDLSIELTGDESFALGASQVYLTDPNDLFDIERATFVEGSIGAFSGQYDPSSYESLRLLAKQGVLSVWLAENKSGTGNGQLVEGNHKIAQIKVPVKNYCENTSTTWRINESGFSEYGNKLYSLNPFITYTETTQLRLATDIIDPIISLGDDEIIKIMSPTANVFTYRWFKNGTLYNETNETSFYPIEEGVYSVEINNECEGELSNELNYRIAALSTESGITHLLSAYPNPYVGQTTLVINLPIAEHVLLELYDLNGKKISTLIDNTVNAGEHLLPFITSHNTEVSVLKLHTPTISQTIRLIEVQND